MKKFYLNENKKIFSINKDFALTLVLKRRLTELEMERAISSHLIEQATIKPGFSIRASGGRNLWPVS